MRTQGEDLSITLELIDTRDNRRLWGEQYQRKLTDLLALQEGIARETAEQLRRRLSPAEVQRRTPREASNHEAYALYWKGRYHVNQRTADGLRKALAYFEQALAKDPNYALAHAGLAEGYLSLVAYGFKPSPEILPKMKAAAEKALASNDQLAEAHAMMGQVWVQEWNWSATESEYQRALEWNPNYAMAYVWYANHLDRMGRFDEAIAAVKRGLELDPLSLGIRASVARQYCYARRYDEAIAQWRAIFELDPEYRAGRAYLIEAYEQKGLYDEALAEHLQGLTDPAEVARLKAVYATSGIRGIWRRQIEQMKERARRQYVRPTTIAKLYAKLGETEEAFAWLEQAYAEHDSDLGFIKANAQYDPLHSDPRYADLLRRMRLPP